MRALWREAARGLRRDRLLAVIIVAGLTVGVANWQLTEVLYRQQRHPLVRDADSLYVVALRRDAPYNIQRHEGVNVIGALIETGLPPRDVDALARHPALERAVVSASGSLAVVPEGGAAEEVPVRFASSGLFEMFRMAFRSGGAYRDGGAEAVLTDELDREWFGGADSVGRTIRIGARSFRVAGVLERERWPRQFDARQPKADALFLPIEAAVALQPWPDPVLPIADPGAFFRDRASSEDIWARLFVTVPRERRDEYEAFVRTYAAAQAGRTPRVLSGRLVPWPEWRAAIGTAEGIYAVTRWMGALLLAACAFNLIRLAMVRAGARAGELGILRALGENRRSLMLRQMLEAALLGLCAGVLGLLLLAIIIPAFNAAIPSRPMTFFLDWPAIAAVLLAGPAAAMLAAAYPAWQFGRMTPAALLRRQ